MKIHGAYQFLEMNITMKRTGALLLAFLLFQAASIAQEKGFVRGNIGDGDFGGPMIGAAVTIAEQAGVGTTTDFDGNYSLSLAPGTYTIQVSFISYATQIFPDVVVTAGEVVMIDAIMESAIEELATVEITAEVRRNSEVAMLMDMKNASSVTDGLSSQTFKKLGDSDLSGAIKRVTGVTVQNGKYVYVRGLGDRYTKTTLNGMSLPGLDPDVNAIQIDIFPTSVLENVAVAKTFSPDLSGDFTGGLVDVVTKSFPDEKTTSFSIGATYIPGMHFNPDFILYERGNMDWTGYDFGNRELPFGKFETPPNPVLNDPTQENITRSFDPNLATKKSSALPNGSFSFNHGNQINRESGATIGYNFVLNYQNQTTFYEGFQSNDYLKDNEVSQTSLVRQVERFGNVGKNSVLWSALASGSYKKNGNQLSLMVLNSQSGETTAAKRVNQDFEQNQATLQEDVLAYSQRSLTTGILTGKHRISFMELTWANAFSISRVYDPDFRETRISTTDGDTNLSTGNGSGINRFWRELNEMNESFKADLKIPVSESGFIKVGGSGTMKFRDFETISFKHTRDNISDISIDPDWYLQEENIWVADTEHPNNDNGTFTIGTRQPANTFEARQNIYAGYLLANHKLLKVIKLIYGVRLEQTQMYYTGEDNLGLQVFDDTLTMDNLSILPSLNAVWTVTEKINVRAAANRTLARPSFKEKSIAEIYDPITKRTFIGNIDLEQTNINNYDLRFEYYLSPKEIFSVGGFYKQFDGHIEMVSFATAPDNLKPRNSGLAESYGVEVELRKGLPNAEKKFLNQLFLSTNVSLVESRVDLKTVLVDNEGQTEFDLRENNLRVGENLSQFRQMAGQSPYAANAALSWENPETQTSISMAYNVQGEQLTIIASGRFPDVYTVPFHSLNFNAYKGFGKDLRSRLTVSVSNILNEDRTLVYRSFGAEDQVYTSFKPGVGIGLKYSYTF